MGILDKLWDDVVAGPQPDTGLGKLRKEQLIAAAAAGDQESRRLLLERRMSGEYRFTEAQARRLTQNIDIKPPPVIRTSSFNDESSPSSSAGTTPREKENVWWSVFHPGSNKSATMERIGSGRFDKATPNSPSVHDWMYGAEFQNKWR